MLALKARNMLINGRGFGISGGAGLQIRHTAPSSTDSRPRELILAVTHT